MTDHNPADGPDYSTASAPATDPDTLEERSRLREQLDEQFSAFYRATIRRLVAFLMNHGASLPTASDIAQETMAKAYRRWTEIRQPLAWVHKVASRSLVRKIADIREEPVEQIPEPTSLLPRPDAFEEWEAEHDALQVLKRLPPRQRQILAWTLSDYRPFEIAEQLGLTPDAVRANLKKARRTATEYLKARGEEQ